MSRLMTILILCLPLSLFPFVAQAQMEIADPIVARIEAEGFFVTDIHRTWLGRILITAEDADHLREVVLNRTTGEILRDRLFSLPRPYRTDEAEPPAPPPSPDAPPSGPPGR